MRHLAAPAIVDKIMNPLKSTQLEMAAGALVLGLLLGWIVRGIATPPPDALTVASYGDWQLTCPPRSAATEDCQLTQKVIDRKSGTVVARVSLYRDRDQVAMTVAAPFDVLLPAGMRLQVGSHMPKRLAYRTCDANGCLADVVMDDDLYDSVVHAEKLGVILTSLNGNSVEIKLSPKGLRDGVDAMNAAEGKRHSWLRRTFL